MNTDYYCIEPLNNSHNKESFYCGNNLLDSYIREQAKQDAHRYISAVYVMRMQDKNDVIGFYTLSCTSMNVSLLPNEIQKKLPRYPSIPAILIGRLAVHKDCQGNRLGELLIFNALKRSLSLSKEIGCWAILVEAKDKRAVDFYKNYGFLQFPNCQNNLYLPTKTVINLINTVELSSFVDTLT